MRTLEQINKEYSEYALQLGDKVHKMKTYPAEIHDLNDKMQCLCQEANEVLIKTKELKKAEAEAPPPSLF